MDELHYKTVNVSLLADPVFFGRVEELLSKMKEVLDDLPADSLPKHISLRQSFPYRGEQNALEEYFQAFFKAVPALKIKTKKVEVFLTEGGRNALVWLRLKENLHLRYLHYKLLLGLKKRFGVPFVGYDGLRWIFHSTVLYNISITDAQAAQELKKRFHNLPFKTVIRPTSGVLFYCGGEKENPTEYCVGKIFSIGT